MTKTPKEQSEPKPRKRPSAPYNHLLQARSRDLSTFDLMQPNEEHLVSLAYKARFAATEGKPICPRCGSETVYIYPCKTKFSCRPKNHSFSLTGGTVFANSKLPVSKIVFAAYRFSRSLKGIAAITTSHDIGVDYDAAYDLNMKFRKAIAYETEGMVLRGTVHVDGAQFGGKIRKPNVRNHRSDDRDPTKVRVMVSITELKGRTLVNVFPQEGHAINWILKSVHPAATICTDMHTNYGELELKDRRLRQVNHTEAFSDKRGANTNYAESRFAMARRSEDGVYHRMSGEKLLAYGQESAWHHDHRHKSDQAKFDQLMEGAFAWREAA